MTALLVSCSGYNKKSDAYGNFEAREIIVSPEVQGKIIWFIVEEGQQLKKGDTAGLIDTVQLYLYKIANLNEVELCVYVSGNMLSGIKIGNEAEVLIDTDKDYMMSMPGKIS